MPYPETTTIEELIRPAGKILIIQADNPDGDSLGSALALEAILGEMGKEPVLFCAVDMPAYLRYLPGWDRVSSELPDRFDLSIIVDASTQTLFGKLQESNRWQRLSSKPCIVLDHHDTIQNEIPFTTVIINDPHRSSTGELIYALAGALGWPVPDDALPAIATSILGDTQGLTNNLTTAETYRVMAELVGRHLDRPALEELRRESSKMPLIIFKYKAMLINRVETTADGRVAYVDIPQSEITAYSALYNPIPLIQTDMQQIKGVAVAIAFKQYADGKITAAIRCNAGYTIGAELAEHFGGGGHPYASGFRITGGRPFNEVKSECLRHAVILLDNLAA